ncbi:phosphoglucosamine mutase [Halobacteriales archaeon QS_5_70_15]|nr:MAG: phosphoglucosamine mutase [Halobacteriales archaeon QS_5_70_15]
MFGTSGIRGPVGEAVTAELALSVGRALGADTDRVVVGRDPRGSGELLLDALAAGLRETGTDVLDLGVAATPTVARAVGWKGCDAGVSVTASHNPPPDNGLKLWQPSGQAFDAPRRERITERVEAEDWTLEPWDRLGSREAADATERHVRALVDAVEFGDHDPPHVTVDVGNGAGGVTVEALSRLGCRVETLNATPDGRFPGRPSEPTAENCTSLAALVGDSDADLGVAHDGDADRTRGVAADGTYLSGDVLLAVLAGASTSPGDRVAVPVDTSLAVEDFLADRGVETTRTPVGDVHVAAEVAAGAAFGGEPSGAWIWPGETLCPDGPLAAVRLAELAAERPLAERAADVPPYPIRRDSLRATDNRAAIDRVREAVAARYDDVSTMDGVRVDVGEGWFLVRASGTQPLVRVTAEAREESRADELLATARSLAVEAGAGSAEE